MCKFALVYPRTNCMKFFQLLICLGLSFGILNPTFAEQSLEEIETELAALAEDILLHDSLSYKITQNKKFATLLRKTLQRPESYNYEFEKLKSISILKSEDDAFRIFTWFIVDKNYREYYGEQYHYFFGFVQRKYQEAGNTEYIVIPLLEMNRIPQGIENMVLDNGNWLGALYYKPQNGDKIPNLKLKYYDRQLSKGGKQKKVKKDFYVLLGWNGNDNRSNYKMVEVMSFDPEDKNRVIFGADVFYFSAIPKFRAIFNYSEYSPFSLNYNWVKVGPVKKANMIVYDHLGTPKGKKAEMKEVWELGSDGSLDGLYFYKRKGIFEWHRDVQLAEKYISKQHRKAIAEVRNNRDKIQSDRNDAIDSYTVDGKKFVRSGENGEKVDRLSKKAHKEFLKKQRELKKAEEAKLKEAGIKPKKIENNN